MPPEILLACILACVLLAVTPGPNMALIMANTLTEGLSAGPTTLAGTSTGLALLVAAVVLGMGSAMALMSQWFDVIGWAGAVYLAYLGVRQLLLRRGEPVAAAPARRRGGHYVQGLLVSPANPKVVLFLGAFLPQFVDQRADPPTAARRARGAVRPRVGAGRRFLRARGGTGARRTQEGAPRPHRWRRRLHASARRPGAGAGAAAVTERGCE
jgi:threonine/homoserine/homoserine lactone efflux protein